MTDRLDFEELLAPIPGDKDTGKDLREDTAHDSVYQRVKTARKDAVDAERKLLRGESAIPDWHTILREVPPTIASESKDLELVAWLCEALLREQGFGGLADGLRLARELIERFWDNLYPIPDAEDGVVARVIRLGNLNETLLQPIRMTPLTEDSSAGEFALWQYAQAQEVERISDPEKKQKRLDGGAATMSAIDRAEAESSAEFYRELVDGLTRCLDELGQLEQAMRRDDRCGANAAPPLTALRGIIKECHVLTDEVLGGKQPAAGSPETTTMEASMSTPSAGAAGAPAAQFAAPGVGGAIQNREQAFETLLQVASFFRATEPHSPVSYHVARAVRWGRMPLPELWQELLQDTNSKSAVFSLIGISEDGEDGLPDLPRSAPPSPPPAPEPDPPSTDSGGGGTSLQQLLRRDT